MTGVIEKIDNIGVAVTDLEVSMEYYKKLGFTFDPPTAYSAVARIGDIALYVFATTSRKVQTRRLDMEGNNPGLDHISFWVGDVDVAAAKLGEAGVVIESGPEDQTWGRRTLTMLDPDGTRIWFLGDLAQAR